MTRVWDANSPVQEALLCESARGKERLGAYVVYEMSQRVLVQAAYRHQHDLITLHYTYLPIPARKGCTAVDGRLCRHFAMSPYRCATSSTRPQRCGNLFCLYVQLSASPQCAEIVFFVSTEIDAGIID